jgi:hypothetical protein
LIASLGAVQAGLSKVYFSRREIKPLPTAGISGIKTIQIIQIKSISICIFFNSNVK